MIQMLGDQFLTDTYVKAKVLKIDSGFIFLLMIVTV
jgi:hypothetical protein